MGWRSIEYLNKYYKPDQIAVLVRVKTKKGEFKDDEVSPSSFAAARPT
jgi:hypothetical protein